MKFQELVEQKLVEKGLPKSALKKNDIWVENLENPSWETAVKLANLLGSSPSDLMALWQSTDVAKA